jgi:hypothetical protein
MPNERDQAAGRGRRNHWQRTLPPLACILWFGVFVEGRVILDHASAHRTTVRPGRGAECSSSRTRMCGEIGWSAGGVTNWRAGLAPAGQPPVADGRASSDSLLGEAGKGASDGLETTAHRPTASRQRTNVVTTRMPRIQEFLPRLEPRQSVPCLDQLQVTSFGPWMFVPPGLVKVA